jgi:hypothetical protein
MPVVNFEKTDGGSMALLSNGKVLKWTLAGTCFIFEPNEDGSYVLGSWRRVQDIPNTQFAGVSVTLNNGRLAVTAGEYGVSALIKSVQVFDPETETWEVFQGKSIAAHSFALMFDNGSLYGGGVPLQTSHAALLAGSKPQDSTSFILESNLPPDVNLGQYGLLGECAGCLLPNGWYLLVDAPRPSTDNSWLTSVFVNLIKPLSYNALIMQWGRADAKPRLNQLSGWWRLPNSDLRGRWASIGQELQQPTLGVGGAQSVWYEPGTMVWMPKINKAVLVDGLGSILTFTPPSMTPDPTDYPKTASISALVNSITRAATMPLSPLKPANTFNRLNNPGAVAATDAGKTAGQIIAQGTLTATAGFDTLQQTAIDAWNQQSWKRVHVRCQNNTKFMQFAYTSVVAAGSQEFRFEGLQLPDFSGATWDGTTTQLGDQLSTLCPILCNMDEPIAIMPNGDLLIIAGETSGGFPLSRYLVKWDGSQSVADIVSDFTGSADVLLPLPDGLVFANGLGYQCSESEMISHQASIPTISQAPSMVVAGERFSMTGTNLTGTHNGGYFSEDYQPWTNIPLVRLTGTDGRVWYCQSRDYSYRGIEPGRTSSCNVVVPYDVPSGSYSMQVVVNGIASISRQITVAPQSGGEATFLNFIQ